MATNRRRQKRVKNTGISVKARVLNKKIVISVLCSIQVLFISSVVYCIFNNKNIQLGYKDIFVKVTDSNSINKNKIKDGGGVPILFSPQDMIKKELYDEQIEKNKKLENELKNFHQSVWFCCSEIAKELSQCLSINTNNINEDIHVLEVNKCIQQCLYSTGYYEGVIDGDQGRTKTALERFQRDKNLVIDGKLGRQTWNVLVDTLGHEIIGDSSKN